MTSKQFEWKAIPELTNHQSGWVGVDLDGTWAEYHGWNGITHIGAPIAAMTERVLAHLAAGDEVRIFTARVCQDQEGYTRHEIARIISYWAYQACGKFLAVTNEKDFGMKLLYDDRCATVEANTGRIICAEI